ncbi:Oidioi.mRNA.OKI2018_I69.PAR.g8874.t1.cds [Oikopleura dioica]|uniref:Oidioi.mRNA.OKI2018_I69.PAR.g8874.t1.cds n=1 Tax=Oikopleura dioica TaxID=34765 RepID=A0ABN7RHZ5_OIKDI|nr:Oidioi.mRNA.OKI2018_I69.PAR.g8874.t1.cds [Oikopleura dioica]
MRFRELLLLCSYITSSPLLSEEQPDLTNLPAEDQSTKSNKDKLKEELKKWDADMIFSNALESFMRSREFNEAFFAFFH